MIHSTPVALSIYDEDYCGLDLYMMTPATTRLAFEAPWAGGEVWKGKEGTKRVEAFLRVLLRHASGGGGTVFLKTGPATESPWAPYSPEVQALGEAILSAQKALVRGLRAVTLNVDAAGGASSWALRVTFPKGAAPWEALYRVEAMLADADKDTAPYLPALAQMLALGAALAGMEGVRVRAGSQSARWAAYALVRANMLYWAAWSQREVAVSDARWRKIKRRVREDLLAGDALRLDEVGMVDWLRIILYAGEVVWQPEVLARWARRGGVGEAPGEAQAGEGVKTVFTPLEMATSLTLALKGVRDGQVSVGVPVKEGRVRRLQAPSPGAAELAWTQVLELVHGEVSDRGLEWLSGGLLPERGGQAMLEGDLREMARFVGAPAFTVENGELVEKAKAGEVYTQFANRAVEDARAHQRYAPGGQGFLLGLSKIAPPGLREAGVEALAVWAERDGLWLRLIAPEASSDGVMVRWRALPRFEDRLSSWILSDWARPEVDLLCAMLWRDLVAEGAQVLRREERGRTGRRRRRRRKQPGSVEREASLAAASPSRRVRLLPRRYARGASWVRWGTSEEHRRLRSPHWVIGHLRVLPEGYRRSRASEGEAKRYGILLPEDPRITFVRPHVRGGGKPEGEAGAAPEVRSRGLMTLVSLFRRQATQEEGDIA